MRVPLLALLVLAAPLATAVVPFPPAPALDLSALDGPRPFTLIPFGQTGAAIVDANGEPVHVWPFPLDFIPADLELLPNGHLVVTAAGLTGLARAVRVPYHFPPTAGVRDPVGSVVMELDTLGRVVWQIHEAGGYQFHWTHDTDYLPATDTFLIADTTESEEYPDRVIEVDRAGTIVWAYYPPASSYPNDADRLPNGNTLVSLRDLSTVVEVDRAGNVVWSYGYPGGPIDHQHNPDRLPNGNTLIADSDHDRLIEVDPSGTIVWSFGDSSVFTWPRDVDLLPNGNLLVADSQNHRVVEITRAGEVVAELSTVALPYDADRLNGAPVVVIDGPADGSTVSNPVRFDVTVTDPSLAGAFYQLFDVTAQRYVGPPAATLPDGPFRSGLQAGHLYRFAVEAWDEGGEGGGYPMDDSTPLRTRAEVTFTVAD